ncbi:MAG: hypothetical protein JJ879_01465 [Sneathiella sp.]|nr:hypothetical protein [Sneathiella sp.]
MTDTAKDLEQLLPFYANGTLEGIEKEAVEKRLQEDEAFRLELDYLKALRANIKAEDMGQSPGELGLARLHKAIDADANVGNLPKPPANENRFWRIAAIAATIALIFALSVQLYAPITGSDDYVTASGTTKVEGPVFQIFFEAEGNQGAISSLLAAEKLTIIEGPTEIGYYRVAAIEKLSNNTRQELLARLNASPLIQEALAE